MISEYYKNSFYATQQVLCKTELFDKEYFWMKDTDGTIYLVPIDENGQPKFA